MTHSASEHPATDLPGSSGIRSSEIKPVSNGPSSLLFSREDPLSLPDSFRMPASSAVSPMPAFSAPAEGTQTCSPFLSAQEEERKPESPVNYSSNTLISGALSSSYVQQNEERPTPAPMPELSPSPAGDAPDGGFTEAKSTDAPSAPQAPAMEESLTDESAPLSQNAPAERPPEDPGKTDPAGPEAATALSEDENLSAPGDAPEILPDSALKPVPVEENSDSEEDLFDNPLPDESRDAAHQEVHFYTDVRDLKPGPSALDIAQARYLKQQEQTDITDGTPDRQEAQRLMQEEAARRARENATVYTFTEREEADARAQQEAAKARAVTREALHGFEINYESESPNYSELTARRHAYTENTRLSALNERETLSFKLTALLFARQLIASFFGNTTLGVIAPATAARFGAAYPSSTPLPFFCVVLISGALASLIGALTDFYLAGGICLVTYICLVGVSAFRGLAEIIVLFCHRRPDAIINAAAVLMPSLVLLLILNASFILNLPFEVTVSLAAASLLGAAASSTLTLDLPQDPVDSAGTLTYKGLVFTLCISILPAFLVLRPEIAASAVGIALFCRLIMGQFLLRHHQHASRLYSAALRMITTGAVMFDILFLSTDGSIINDCLLALYQSLTNV